MNANFLTIAIIILTIFCAEARVDPENLKKMKDRVQLAGSRMDCQPSQSYYEMEINNVRAGLLAGGDMWWNLQEGRYIVPKPAPGFPEVSAIFAGGIWIGGVDPNGALKLAGVTYRAGNNSDFYSGPLDENGQTSVEDCNDWDRHFVVKGDNIRSHINNYRESIKNNEAYLCESIPDDVKYWPARGNIFFTEEYDFTLPDQNLADFFDVDGDGQYNPCQGDYPVVDQSGCGEVKIPDEIVFWMFNDNGGPHRLSQTTPIQIEVQAQAFAFVSSNEINDMTFYSYKVINKASDDIRDCYFGLWVDPDLGCSDDDYIGCDVDRSMAYIYNEDAVDGLPGSSCPGGVATYGSNVPMVGIDLFRGPRGPKVFCGEDEQGNPILCDPEPGTGESDTIVELGMTSFIYQNRGVSNPPEATQDPAIGFEFYNILKGRWKDGTAVTFGNSGFDPASIDTVKFVFPDAPDNASGWSMCTADLPFDDRRTVQSTGPFLLQPGAKNKMIFGVVFVPNVHYPCPSIHRLQFADDLAQAMFDNCFGGLQGPDAPDMTGVRLDEQLILILSNDTSLLESNNAKLGYIEKDLLAPQGVPDPYYRFEGYQIYQLANPNVSLQELDNIEKARRIRQVDLKNGVDEIYNWYPISNPDPFGSTIWVPERQVKGEDKGIQHSFSITKDEFAVGNRDLKNNKEYYFTVLAYAHNNYEPYNTLTNTGQRTPYIQSQKNVRTYTFSPRALDDVVIPTTYGQEAPITRIEGIGTSFNALDLADGEVESILDGTFDGLITYKAGYGPINPRVVDPLGIKEGIYRLEIIGEYNDSTVNIKQIRPGAQWKLTNITTGEIIVSEKSIDEINEQIILDKGFSIQVNQVGEPGDQFDENNGAVAQVFEYEDDNATHWWSAVPALEGIEVVNNNGNIDYLFPFAESDNDDPNNALTKIDNGHFIPFKLAKWEITNNPYITPGWKGNLGFAINPNRLRLRIQDLNNVDIVFTSNKSKWSKCMVVETAVNDYGAGGYSTLDNKVQFDLKSHHSIDQDGNEIDGTGMSYFPGYAIDVETGERLNIFFGENSVFRDDNDIIGSQVFGQTISSNNIGNDMIWNPTSQLFHVGPNMGEVGSYNNILGGQHFIYVTRQEYDGCHALSELTKQGGLFNLIDALSFITWTAVPVPQQPLLSLQEGLIPNDLTVKLRVTNPFNRELDNPNPKSPHIFEAVGGLPVYEFGFEGVEIIGMVSTEEVESQILDNISISPNPYYENSAYGQSANVVRIGNLPQGSVVSVYNLEGKFVRRFSREMGSNFIDKGETQELEWNLNDNNGVRITSGIYLIQIAVPHLGIQKTLKWIKV